MEMVVGVASVASVASVAWESWVGVSEVVALGCHGCYRRWNNIHPRCANYDLEVGMERNFEYGKDSW